MDADWRQAFDLGERELTPEEPGESDGQAASSGGCDEGLSRSRKALGAELSASLTDRVDEQTWERLEEALILADVGAPTTAKVVRRLEDEVEGGDDHRRRGDARAADRAAGRDRRLRGPPDRPQRPARR